MPVLNGPVKRVLADFTAGPYQASERAQTIEDPAGVNYKPLYRWRSREHNGGRVQIVPTTTMTIALWANRGADGPWRLSSRGPHRKPQSCLDLPRDLPAESPMIGR